MSSQRILVVGSTGMLGCAVSAYFSKKGYSVTSVDRSVIDIGKDDHKKLQTYINNVDVVINCAGVIKPRIETNSIESVLLINSTFPWNLAKMCKAVSVPCFHITTDCVYSGKRGQYTEKDLVDVDDLYGLSKSAGDTTLAMTLRTSIIGEEKNQSRSLLSWAQSQSGKTVNGFSNHLWNGVTTLYLAEIIEKIIKQKLYKEGIFHIFSEKAVTKAELLHQMNDVYELKLNINETEADQAIDRRLDSIYDLHKQVVKKSILEQLRDMRSFFRSL